jgi:hypothetical protein
MSDPSLRSTVETLRRRIARAAFLGTLARHGAAALVVGSIAALLARMGLGWSSSRALLLLLVVLPAFATAWFAARRRFVSAATAATWLDVELGASGRYVTAFEIAARGNATAPALPADLTSRAPRTRWFAVVRPSLPSALFALLALLVPVHFGDAAVVPPAVQTSQLDRLAEKLASLEETVQLDEELRAELHQRLDHTREQADAAPLSSTFEAIDQLSQRLAHEGERASEKIDEAKAELDSDALTRALEKEPAKAQELVAGTLQQLSKDGLGANLPPELAQQLPEGMKLPDGAQLDAKELAKLSSELTKMLDGKLAKLLKSGVIDPSKLKPFDGKLKVHKCDEKCRQGGG